MIIWIDISLGCVLNGLTNNNSSDDDLAPNKGQAIIRNDDGLVYWRIKVSLGLNEVHEVTGGFPSQMPAMRNFDVLSIAPKQAVEQTIETPVIWDTFVLIVTSL